MIVQTICLTYGGNSAALAFIKGGAGFHAQGDLGLLYRKTFWPRSCNF